MHLLFSHLTTNSAFRFSSQALDGRGRLHHNWSSASFGASEPERLRRLRILRLPAPSGPILGKSSNEWVKFGQLQCKSVGFGDLKWLCYAFRSSDFGGFWAFNITHTSKAAPTLSSCTAAAEQNGQSAHHAEPLSCGLSHLWHPRYLHLPQLLWRLRKALGNKRVLKPTRDKFLTSTPCTLNTARTHISRPKPSTVSHCSCDVDGLYLGYLGKIEPSCM